MKRHNTSILTVKVNKLPETATVSEIEFIFKQTPSENAPALKKSFYKLDGSGDVSLRDGTNNIYEVPFSMADTSVFLPLKRFYMDLRVHLVGTNVIPTTPIVDILMSPTLFSLEDL